LSSCSLPFARKFDAVNPVLRPYIWLSNFLKKGLITTDLLITEELREVFLNEQQIYNCEQAMARLDEFERLWWTKYRVIGRLLDNLDMEYHFTCLIFLADEYNPRFILLTGLNDSINISQELKNP